jgi:hypothetical protein
LFPALVFSTPSSGGRHEIRADHPNTKYTKYTKKDEKKYKKYAGEKDMREGGYRMMRATVALL